MIRNVIGSIAKSARRLFTSWRSLIVLIVLYAAMLISIYLFASTGLATLMQILLTFLAALLAPLLFFIVQAMCVGYIGSEGSGRLFVSSLKGFWKLVLMTVPFVLLAWLAVWLIGKIPVEAQAAASTVQRIAPHPATVKPLATPATNWKAVGVTALELIVLGFILPLAMVNLWIATNRDGMKQAVKGGLKTLARAFAPGSALIYILGLLVFGVIPYFLVVMRPPATGPWVEVSLFVLKLIAAALFVLFGWAVTIGALAERQASQMKGRA
ncbi:MAG: hypothetical protein ACREDR_06360 [Blastocatellia bacterium]